MDWLHYAIKAKIICLSFFLSRLDDMKCKPLEYQNDTITTIINAQRYLIIKRLDFSPYNWFNCSFSEAATFGGENYTLYPYQFNPLVFLHTFQHNWDKAANLFFHLDAKVFLPGKAFYGALLIDDYQLEPDPNGEPNHYGVKVGIELADVMTKKSFVVIEYSFLSRWIYAIFAPYQRYEYAGHPIGFPYGPDCDEIYAKWLKHLSNCFDFYLGGSYLRKGETNVNTAWPIPEEPRIPGTFFPENNFLSGVVEKTFSIDFGIRFNLQNRLVYDVSAGYLYIKNHRHAAGAEKKTICFKLNANLLKL